MFLQNLVQKAQQFIEPTLSVTTHSTDRRPTKASLFRHQFRLPDAQNPLQEISAELTLSPNYSIRGSGDPPEKEREKPQGNHYVGKLHLSEAYMCFSTTPTSFLSTATTSTSSAFTGQTHGGGPSGNGFTFPLCAIRRVERLHSSTFQVIRL